MATNDIGTKAKAAFENIFPLQPQEQALALGELELEVRAEVEELLRQDTTGFLKPSRRFQTPDTIGGYILDKELGEGGMGRVFKATRPGSAAKAPVALKILPWMRACADLESRFRREMELHDRLRHRYIARVLDGGTSDGALFLVTELVDGVPITEFTSTVPLDEKLRLFLRVCEAVQFAHRNLIVHRDLKPSNILVSTDGSPHLLDFGIAKALDDEKPLTGSVNAPMTPEYASPEQVLGMPITTATDVYSLGVMLFEILSGKRPYTFQSRSPGEITRVVCQLDPSPLNSGIADLDSIVKKALQKEPGERYSSVEAFHQDVERYLMGLPVKAVRASSLYRFSKFVRRNRIAVSFTALTVLVLSGGVVATTWQARIAQAQRALAERERARAEKQAKEATLQRERAESSSRKEQEQRLTAERNAMEAGRQRRTAEAERAKADSRLKDIRQVANNLLFDFDTAIENVQGTNKARELVVEKGLSYLDKVAKETTGDETLQEEIATGYERLARIQGNVFQSSRGDYKRAREGYEKAVAIRQALLVKHPRNIRFRRALALAKVELADGLYTSGEDRSGTMLREAGTTLQELSAAGDRSISILQGIQRSDTRLCSILLPAGDVFGALARCQSAIAVGRELLSANPSDATTRSGLAASLSQLGLALRTNRQPREAIEVLEQAASEHQQLADAAPTNSRHASNVAGSHALIGGTWMALGERGKAIASFQRGIQTNRKMLQAEPTDARAKTTLGFSLIRLASLLFADGRKQEAVSSGREGLEMFRYFADRPNATPDDLNNYASFLLEIDVMELRNPAVALSYAKRAVGSVKEPGLALSDTLAEALTQTGDLQGAIEVLARALAAHPAPSGPNLGLRGQMEEKLKRLKEKIAQQLKQSSLCGSVASAKVKREKEAVGPAIMPTSAQTV